MIEIKQIEDKYELWYDDKLINVFKNYPEINQDDQSVIIIVSGIDSYYDEDCAILINTDKNTTSNHRYARAIRIINNQFIEIYDTLTGETYYYNVITNQYIRVNHSLEYKEYLIGVSYNEPIYYIKKREDVLTHPDMERETKYTFIIRLIDSKVIEFIDVQVKSVELTELKELVDKYILMDKVFNNK